MQNSDQPTRNLFEKLTAFLPLMWLSLSFMVGILVASQIHLSRSTWLVLAHSLLPAQIPLNRKLWLLLVVIVSLISIIVILLRIFHARLHIKFFKLPSSSLLLVFSLDLCFPARRSPLPLQPPLCGRPLHFLVQRPGI